MAARLAVLSTVRHYENGGKGMTSCIRRPVDRRENEGRLLRSPHVSLPLLVAVCLTAAFVLSATSTALAWCGGVHLWAGEQATWLFRQGLPDPTCISRNPEWPIFPELLQQSYGWDPESSYDPGDPEDKTWVYENWDWIKRCSMKADDAVPSTLNHFWLMEEGLHDDPGYGTYNSWEKTYWLWIAACEAWHAGDLGWAYTNLGYCMHHIQDMLQPAHSNQDLHPGQGLVGGDDAIEEWFKDDAAIAMYSWDGSTGPPPGPEIPWPSRLADDNSDLLNDILNAGYWDAGSSYPVSDVADFLALADPSLPYNMQKFFYLLYWANQFGNYFASDDEDGVSNDYDPTGWLEGYPGFPPALPGGSSIHDWHGLIDNDDTCEHGNPTGRCRNDECDCDGDLTLISTWCYGGTFKVSPLLIDLFRRTVDGVPPVTTAEVTRLDGEPVVEWNNSPVTVQLIDATDYGNPGFRVSNVWKIWGLCDGNPPANYDAPSWGISEDGKHKVECMSTDMCGNVEQDQDIEVWIDMTPPEVTFPDLRPNYLTSENFIATWVATDAHSGVASEYALLDDVQEVTKGQVIDLAEMAGEHWLRVIAYDVAGNYADVFYYFEVFIDANSWARPVLDSDKTKGKGMFCAVEFPAPYDVRLIDMSTCTLAVGGTLDLTADDPVVGALAVLQAERMTGVGDSDGDHIRDRMLRFDKEQFVAALSGQVGDIPAVVRGGLLPDGMPRFLGVVTVPVFAPGG